MSICRNRAKVTEYGQPGLGLCSASKAVLKLLTKSWAAKYGPSGVRVNAVSSGPAETEGILSIDRDVALKTG
ncbi:SDR family oxidoreductase [Paenibacillus agricola]|uniref:SDR family oxidoreductase n=1 Tax=Paenibacillus agricola TaxID=2716264 RepID=A0ABX0J809_9BACL|nr:SDR family oxidoreductase [Paenibacillus agricola]NHN31525.1 SDR family oxidoreductase [Paenibacillus agricola]